MSARAGVITFPGSNGDYDALSALTDSLLVPARMVDYRETDLPGLDLIVVPGGFSYGDHLRCGAIARFAPVMRPLREFAARGGAVLGICNGFQILTEAHLLPGALLRNSSLEFHCEWVHIRVETNRTAWTDGLSVGDVLRLPVAHGEGAYYADVETLTRLQEGNQIVFRYCGPRGDAHELANFNGSVDSIAGVCNQAGNVVGLMPHPERACDPLIGGADGLAIFRSALAAVSAGV